jgi:hypothetical protein
MDVIPEITYLKNDITETAYPMNAVIETSYYWMLL